MNASDTKSRKCNKHFQHQTLRTNLVEDFSNNSRCTLFRQEYQFTSRFKYFSSRWRNYREKLKTRSNILATFDVLSKMYKCLNLNTRIKLTFFRNGVFTVVLYGTSSQKVTTNVTPNHKSQIIFALEAAGDSCSPVGSVRYELDGDSEYLTPQNQPWPSLGPYKVRYNSHLGCIFECTTWAEKLIG